MFFHFFLKSGVLLVHTLVDLDTQSCSEHLEMTEIKDVNPRLLVEHGASLWIFWLFRTIKVPSMFYSSIMYYCCVRLVHVFFFVCFLLYTFIPYSMATLRVNVCFCSCSETGKSKGLQNLQIYPTKK